MNREKFLEEVQRLIKAGTPYREKGCDPDGFSCAELIYYLYSLWGVELEKPVDLDAIFRCRAKDFDIIQPPARFMDIVHFRSPELGERADHLGLMIDNNSFCHCDAIQKYVGRSQISRFRLAVYRFYRYRHRTFEE